MSNEFARPWQFRSLDACLQELERLNLPISRPPNAATEWCNATFDDVMCWPATPGGESYSHPCPPMKGLDPNKRVAKLCHISGHWLGRTADDFSRLQGHTPYAQCLVTEYKGIVEDLGNSTALEAAQKIARIARYLELVGLFLSIVSLIASIAIFLSIKRLRIFRNLLHVQLMSSILLAAIIRLCIYIDSEVSRPMGIIESIEDGQTLHSTWFVCEAFYGTLEYAKTVAFTFMILESFYLHSSIVSNVFHSKSKLWVYCCIGWSVPIPHVVIWATVSIYMRGHKKCFDTYYFNPEFWILDGIRFSELIISFFLLAIVIWVLWIRVRGRGSHSETEMEQMRNLRKSAIAGLIIIPLFAIPNILQMIPVIPSKKNVLGFGIYTIIVTFFYMFQGFFISMVHWYSNYREVIMSVRWGYERFQMPQTALDMFRGSQAPSDHTDETTNDHFAQSQPISDLLMPHTVLGGEKSAVKLESDEADQTQQTRTSATGNFLNGTSAAARFLNTVEADQNIAERSALLNAVELCEIPPSS